MVPHDPTLQAVDLRLLRIFQLVVRYNGFSAAQEPLGMTQATISAHMKQLEGRLGVRLCERGRSGFYLTEPGKQVHSAMLDLFGSIEGFQSAVGAARGELGGTLHFGTVDAMHTNPDFDLPAALADFARRAPKVQVELDIAAPQALAQGLLAGRYHVVLTPSQPFPGRVRTAEVFGERQMLYCGSAHPLFQVPDIALTAAAVAEYPFAGRSYMNEGSICGVSFNWSAVTSHMEGTALLIGSGAYTGFLPRHFAEHWVSRGQMRSLLPEVLWFDDHFLVAHRHRDPNPAVDLLATALRRQAETKG
jgi:DNA-binding transcriptional LysR family regulator